MKEFNLKNFFARFSENKLIICMSVLFSVALWISTVIFNKDSYSVVKISDVPIVTNLSNTQAEQLGLSVVNITPKNVSVYIKGPRHKIASIKKDEIVVSPKTYSNVLNSGSYNLELNAFFKKPHPDVTIESISHKNVVFVFDVLETKMINLCADEIDIKLEEGYIKEETVCQPESLFVSGPKKSIDKLKTIKLKVNKGPYTLNSSKTFDATPQFMSVDGNVMDSSVFKYNSDIKFKITVPIYKTKKLAFKLLYKNAPEGLNLNLLNPIINPSFLEVCGPEESVNKINEIVLGYVDLKNLTEEKTDFNFNVKMPADLKNFKNILNAYVSFKKDDLDSKVLDVKGINIFNVPKGYEIFVNSKVIKNVKIVGLKQYLKNINSSDLAATLDCSKIDVKKGKQNVLANIDVFKNGAWVVGENKCSVTIEKKWNHNLQFHLKF